AEITNVEITTVVMLALGFDETSVDEYRTSELLKSKELLESGKSYHPMAFEDIILAEIDTLNSEFSSQIITEFEEKPSNAQEGDVCYELIFTLTQYTDYSLLPLEIRNLLQSYFPTGTFPSVDVELNSSHYTEYEYKVHEERLILDWWPDSVEEDVPTSSVYSGTVTYNDFTIELSVSSIPTGYASPEFEISSIVLTEAGEGGIRVTQEKVDSVWQEPVVGRNHGRTGGSYVDTCSSVNYEQTWGSPFDGWQYRKTHNLIGSSGAGSYYQIRFTIHYGSGTDSGEHVYLNAHSQTDFEDIRFADDENTLLDYWMEICTIGNQAVFWVEVKDNLDVDQTIHIYYGNEDAESASDGDATFAFFDDFNDGSIDANKWDITDSPVESGGLLTTYDSTRSEGVKTDGTFQYGRFHMRGLMGSVANNWDGRAGFGNSMAGSDLQGASFWTVNSGLTRTITGGASATTSTDIGAFDSGYHIWDVVWYSGGAKFYVDGALEATHTTNLPTGATNILLQSYHEYTTCYFDYVFLSKAVATEPSHGSWSSERNLLNLDDWSYRKSHQIYGSPTAGVGYQINIDVHYAIGSDTGNQVYLGSHCESDFSDVRFVSGDGCTILDYWIESYTAADEASFWVRVEGDLSYDQVIYIYYGNDAATSASDGDATFILFDDFNDASFDTEKWSHVGDPAGSESGGTYSQPNDEGWHQGIASDAMFGPGVSVEASVYSPWTSISYGNSVGVYLYDTVPSDAAGWYVTDYFGIDLRKHSDGAKWVIAYDHLVPTTDESHILTDWTGAYHTLRFDYTPTTNRYYYDSTLVKSSTEGQMTGDVYMYIIGNGPAVTFDVDWTFVRKCVATEPTHGIWGDEVSSVVFESNGDYLYVPSIPVDDGWHGPVLARTLPSAFTIEQLDIFSVELSLVHDDIGTRMSTTAISLYDECGLITFSLELIDDTTDVSQKLRVVYHSAGSGGAPIEIPFATEYLPGDYTGMASIRYDPHQGLIAKVSGADEYAFNTFIETDRLITSMSIESLRNGNELNHDERIDDIKVSFAFSEYAVFDEDCGDMDGFHKDLSIDHLLMPISDGTINSVHNTLNVISVADGSGLHGPAYVKPLDRPFRLYQLSDFSVTMELLAGTASQGMMQVALFDENMDYVLGVSIEDSSTSASGRMVTVFCPDNNPFSWGGQQPSIISSPFKKTGTLWFDGSDVQSYIEGVGTQGLYTSSLDADVIISYLVVYGAGYNSEPLCNMRVHDIHIEVDVNAEPPSGGESEPVECDGTVDGSITELQKQDADLNLQDGAAQLISYVTFEPWPYLHWVKEEQNNDET
ncbi:MAG: DUF2341 domain-containing protein, partial [Candidatus Thorarchaeota archaeon]|nr:DUF2341 domain-containing protein [Candidatus Thorarchaeota archaeon]